MKVNWLRLSQATLIIIRRSNGSAQASDDFFLKDCECLKNTHRQFDTARHLLRRLNISPNMHAVFTGHSHRNFFSSAECFNLLIPGSSGNNSDNSNNRTKKTVQYFLDLLRIIMVYEL